MMNRWKSFVVMACAFALASGCMTELGDVGDAELVDDELTVRTGTLSPTLSTGTVSSNLQPLVAFDGRWVTESFARSFAEGEMLSWGLCEPEARDAGACTFWFVEQRAGGAINTLHMTPNRCSSTAKWCRDGYVASMRSRATHAFDGERVQVTQKLWITKRIRSSFYSETYLGHAEGSFGEHDFDLAVYDASGALFDQAAATVIAQSSSGGVSGCDVAWEAGLLAAGVVGAAAGAASATAGASFLGTAFLGLAGATQSIAGVAAGGVVLSVGAALATPAVVGTLVAVVVGAVAVGAVALAVNHWCVAPTTPPTPPRVPPGGWTPTSPSGTTGNCPEGTFWSYQCWDCSYDTSDWNESAGELTITHHQRECCQWGCFTFGST